MEDLLLLFFRTIDLHYKNTYLSGLTHDEFFSILDIVSYSLEYKN